MAVEGKVAAIINVREVAINIGKNKGVLEGMIFAILAESPIEVADPSTGELLDQIDREKVRVKATDVRERLSICRTYETYRTPGLMPDIFGPGYFTVSQERVRTLTVEDSELPPPLSPQESYVKIGDRVRQVVGDG